MRAIRSHTQSRRVFRRGLVKLHAHASKALKCKHEATVLYNKAGSLDGNVRVLTISVFDPEKYLDTRRVAGKAACPPWRSGLTVPGQLVDIKAPDQQAVTRVIATSPSEAQHQSSLYVDRTVIEVVACKGEWLASVNEGAAVSVSDVHGVGFSNFLNPESKLGIIIEDKRPLIIAASGAEGAAAAKAVLEWEPVQAMATEEPVLYVCLADNKQSAALLAQEDKWRAVGITISEVYVPVFDGSDQLKNIVQVFEYLPRATVFDAHILVSSSLDSLVSLGVASAPMGNTAPRQLIQIWQSFFKRQDVKRLFRKHWKSSAAIFRGLSPAEAKAVLAILTDHGVPSDHILQ